MKKIFIHVYSLVIVIGDILVTGFIQTNGFGIAVNMKMLYDKKFRFF